MTRTTRVLRHGGREVLRISLEYPQGEGRMERHARELALALSEYAQRELLPPACAALEEAVQEGRSYRFFPHRYTVSFQKSETARSVRLVLVATHEAQNLITQHTLPMYWTRDGAWQRKKQFHTP